MLPVFGCRGKAPRLQLGLGRSSGAFGVKRSFRSGGGRARRCSHGPASWRLLSGRARRCAPALLGGAALGPWLRALGLARATSTTPPSGAVGVVLSAVGLPQTVQVAAHGDELCAAFRRAVQSSTRLRCCTLLRRAWGSSDEQGRRRMLRVVELLRYIGCSCGAQGGIVNGQGLCAWCTAARFQNPPCLIAGGRMSRGTALSEHCS